MATCDRINLLIYTRFSWVGTLLYSLVVLGPLSYCHEKGTLSANLFRRIRMLLAAARRLAPGRAHSYFRPLGQSTWVGHVLRRSSWYAPGIANNSASRHAENCEKLHADCGNYTTARRMMQYLFSSFAYRKCSLMRTITKQLQPQNPIMPRLYFLWWGFLFSVTVSITII